MVLDGAYAKYVTKDDYDNGFSLVDQFDNIILTRTFSKAYGLAGLRLGWCYTSKKVATILNKVKGPFNTQSLSQEMAIIALEDKEYLDQIVKNNQEVGVFYTGMVESFKGQASRHGAIANDGNVLSVAFVFIARRYCHTQRPRNRGG